MDHDQRTRIWVDEFQTRLTWRIAAYLGLFLLVLVNFLFAWKMLSEGVDDPVAQFLEVMRDNLPVGVCLLVLVPVMAWDAMRFTHRLVGPLVRFRRGMQGIARGEGVRPIRLREGDYLTDLRDDFNQMLTALQERGAVPPSLPSREQASPTARGVAAEERA
jgi:hypothetical protein